MRCGLEVYMEAHRLVQILREDSLSAVVPPFDTLLLHDGPRSHHQPPLPLHSLHTLPCLMRCWRRKHVPSARLAGRRLGWPTACVSTAFQALPFSRPCSGTAAGFLLLAHLRSREASRVFQALESKFIGQPFSQQWAGGGVRLRCVALRCVALR